MHGTKYDYSKVDLNLPFKAKVEIICPKHGSFFQRKDSHTGGAGCRFCVHEGYTGKYKYTTEEYVLKLKEIYGETLLFDKTEFNGTKERVTVTCPIHGDYTAIAASLLKGHHCQKCNGDSQRTTLSEFKIRANELHKIFMITLNV